MSKHIKTLPQKREGYRHTLIMALDVATTREEFETLCMEGGMGKATAAVYLNKFNLKNLKNEKSIKWKKNKFYTIINCGYCNTEFEIRKKLLKISKNEKHYCSVECHKNNRSNIVQSVLDKHFAEMGLNWKELKDYTLKYYKRYRRAVRAWAKFNLRKYKPNLYEIWINDKNIELDHKWAVVHGFRRGVNPELMSHIDNLQLLTKKENGLKNDDWIDDIIPDVLKEESRKPPSLKRIKVYHGPPRGRQPKKHKTGWGDFFEYE